MPQPYNRSLPPGVPGEDFARREDAWKSTSPAVTQLAIQWFQLAIQWFQLAIQFFGASQFFLGEVLDKHPLKRRLVVEAMRFGYGLTSQPPVPGVDATS